VGKCLGIPLCGWVYLARNRCLDDGLDLCELVAAEPYEAIVAGDRRLHAPHGREDLLDVSPSRVEGVGD
jgi:hypothetical protein